MKDTNELAQKLEEMISRYQLEIKKRDSQIEALTEDIAVLSKVATSKGHLREAPESEAYKGMI